MRQILAALAITLALLAYHTEAHAACTTTTIFDGRGGMLLCTSCCFPGGNCTVSCI